MCGGMADCDLPVLSEPFALGSDPAARNGAFPPAVRRAENTILKSASVSHSVTMRPSGCCVTRIINDDFRPTAGARSMAFVGFRVGLARAGSRCACGTALGIAWLSRLRVLRYRSFHRFLAALRAISARLVLPILFARAKPPFRPSATAAAFFPSSVSVSAISPVAIRMTWTAFAITSAGRFWPFGPLGIGCHPDGFATGPTAPGRSLPVLDFTGRRHLRYAVFGSVIELHRGPASRA